MIDNKSTHEVKSQPKPIEMKQTTAELDAAINEIENDLINISRVKNPIKWWMKSGERKKLINQLEKQKVIDFIETQKNNANEAISEIIVGKKTRSYC